MDGVAPPDTSDRAAVPDAPHSRFCAPLTAPEVLSTEVGQTVALAGVWT